MKTPQLLASFAVAATAAAADLKDSAAVAQHWKENTVGVHAPLTWDLSLKALSTTTTLPTWPVFVSDCWPAPKSPSPEISRPEPLIDPPGYHIPKVLPNDLPRGAKPWEYGGQTYWIIPLVPSREK